MAPRWWAGSCGCGGAAGAGGTRAESPPSMPAGAGSLGSGLHAYSPWLLVTRPCRTPTLATARPPASQRASLHVCCRLWGSTSNKPAPRPPAAPRSGEHTVRYEEGQVARHDLAKWRHQLGEDTPPPPGAPSEQGPGEVRARGAPVAGTWRQPGLHCGPAARLRGRDQGPGGSACYATVPAWCGHLCADGQRTRGLPFDVSSHG